MAPLLSHPRRLGRQPDMSRFVTMIELMAPFPQYLWEGWSFTPRVIVVEA